MMLGGENLFLIVLAFVWIIGAVLQDFRRREVDNLWNFSLIAIAIFYRLVVSISGGEYFFVLNGVIGFAIFLILGNLFYYTRLFAGGDAKLLIALGAILPLSYDWIVNLKIFGFFILLFFVAGSFWALFYALFLMTKNWKRFSKDFARRWLVLKGLLLLTFLFVIVWVVIVVVLGRFELILIGFILLLFPILLVFAKSIEEGCLIKRVSPKDITEGDWLYEDIKVGKKKIRASWEGLSKKDLELIQGKYKKKVMVKYGIPFTPSFLIGFIILLWMIHNNVWF